MKIIRNKKDSKRTAMTLIETSLAIVVGLAVLVGAFSAFKKMYTSSQGSSAFQVISTVLDGIEGTKLSNSNVYPIGATVKISALTILENELGGSNQTADVADWTYSCSAGSGKTITLVTTAYSDVIIADLAAQKISSTKAPWSATAALGVVTITRSNVVCR